MKSVSHYIRELTLSTFESEARDGDRPLVLLFSAAQCPASRTLERMVNELAPAYEKHLHFARVNAVEAADLLRRYRIHSVPGLVVLHRETVLYEAMGVLPRRELETIFDAAARRSDSVVEAPVSQSEN
ncbi:MAG TPA: thioredoxin family protein [Verrucomicrobiota bacterium]|nr:thioredoxin family protein [Verrucomicrobiota bacterium]